MRCPSGWNCSNATCAIGPRAVLPARFSMSTSGWFSGHNHHPPRAGRQRLIVIADQLVHLQPGLVEQKAYFGCIVHSNGERLVLANAIPNDDPPVVETPADRVE